MHHSTDASFPSDHATMAGAAERLLPLDTFRQPDVWPVAVADEQLVLVRQRREGYCGGAHMLKLDTGVRFLATSEQGIAAEHDYQAHGSARSLMTNEPDVREHSLVHAVILYQSRFPIRVIRSWLIRETVPRQGDRPASGR